MKDLRVFLEKLDRRQNPEERIIYQVMDLKIIQYNGLEQQRFLPGDDIDCAIDLCMHGFLWLYEKGISMERSVKDLLQSDEDKARYDEFSKAFYEVNQFMANNMSLKE